MSAVASSAPSSSRRDQAGPLPPKRGEFNYEEASAAAPAATPTDPDTEADIADAAAAAAYARNNDHGSSSSPAPRATPSSSSTSIPISSTTTAAAAAQSTTSLPAKNRRWHRIFSAKGGPLIAGFRGPTLVKFTGLIGLLAALATVWALATKRLSKSATDVENQDGADGENQMPAYMGLFLHVAFAIVILVVLIFLERCLFVLRAEWWVYKHPGETLPLHRRGEHDRHAHPGGLAPWNRPPLPTYAAALGIRGTGDVEDEAIAAPPPPAYGNTRGSVLLLASTTLRRISSTGSVAINRLSQLRSPRTPRTPGDFQQIPESRPVSYISTEGLQDIERAHELEQSLARLEASAPQPPASSSASISSSRPTVHRS